MLVKGRIHAYQFLSSTKLFSNSELDYDAWSTDGFTMIISPFGIVVGSSIDPDVLSEQEEASQVTTVPENTESDDEVDIEDVLPVDSRAAKGFIEHEGRMVHKASVVRILFSSDPKSSDRLRRVRGMSKHTTSTLSSDVEDESLCIGDPCCTLARTQAGQVCLAFFLVDSISNQSGKKVPSLATAELNVKVTGLIAVLKDKENEWVWDRSLSAQLTTHGSHTYPVNPDVSISENSRQMTYHFNEQELTTLCELMWSQCKGKVAELASTNSNTLLYANSNNDQCFICFKSNDVASSLNNDKRSSLLVCKLCPKKIRKVQMRLHVGFHMLKGDCLPYACGLCGQSCTCSIEIKKTSQHFKGPHSDCAYFYKFSFASAAKSTVKSPCTNIPMLRQEPGCSQVHWKYNMATHYQDRHNSNLPEAFKITSDEQTQVLKVGRFERSK